MNGKNRNKKFNNKQKERMKNPLTDRRRKEKKDAIYRYKELGKTDRNKEIKIQPDTGTELKVKQLSSLK